MDTEGSFVATRYAQIVQAILPHSNLGTTPQVMETVLRRLHVCRTYDATELYATVKQLDRYLRSRLVTS